MSDHLWFYELLNEVHGPISTEQIQQLVAEGRLYDSDRIRPQTSEEWITVTDLKTLVENVASGEDEWEEVTDLDDLNFTFEDSSAGVDRASESRGFDDSDDDDRHAELDIDSFQLSGDPEQARHSAFDSVTGRSSDVGWMVESLGQVLGPMSITELVGMAEAGALSANDRIRDEASESWVTADSVEAVATALSRGAAGLDKGSSMTAATEKRLASSAGKATSSGRGDTAKGKSRSSSSSRAKGKPTTAAGRKRRRKKKRSKKDQLLAEIFSDVFAEDGKVRDISERPDLANSGPAAPAGSIPSPGMSPAAGAPAPVAMNSPMSPAAGLSSPGLSASPGIGGMSGVSPGMPATGSAGAGMPSARPAFTPPPKAKKRRGSSSFDMPDPKIIAGVGGGILVAFLMLGSFMGWFTVPGFGVNAESFITEFEAEYPKAIAKQMNKADWEDFRTDYIYDARSVASSYTATAGTDPAAQKILNKALLIVRLLEIPHNATVAREATWKEYQETK